MKTPTAALFALLAFGIATLWVEEAWAWAIFEIGIFCLAAWRVAIAGRWIVRPAFAPLACAALWPALQTAAGTTVSRGQTEPAALTWFVYLLVAMLAADLLSEHAERRKFLACCAAFGAVLAAIAVASRYSAAGKVFWLFPTAYADGVLGPFVNRNQFAAWMELLLPVALYFAATEHRFRAVWVSAAAVLFAAVAASASRAGFVLAGLEAVVCLGLLALRGGVPRRRMASGAVQFGLAALLAGAAFGWSDLRTRFEARAPETLRADAARASIQMVKDHPWAGTGLGTWTQIYPRHAQFDSGVFMNQAHNDWLQFAAEGGLPFVLFFLCFAALCCRPAIRTIYGLGIVAFLLHACVDYPMQQRPALAAWFFAIAGVVLARRGQNPELE